MLFRSGANAHTSQFGQAFSGGAKEVKETLVRPLLRLWSGELMCVGGVEGVGREDPTGGGSVWGGGVVAVCGDGGWDGVFGERGECGGHWDG